MKPAFSRFLSADPDRLHAAAHSHHPWPDVTFDAHVQAWEDAAAMMDDKWDHVFGTVFPAVRRRVAAVLGLPDPDTLVFAPNTHEFVLRIASTLPTPFRVLTTDSEFHSFSRQVTRWEREGSVEVTRVAAQPYESFPARFASVYDAQELVFFSQVHFNSGYVTPDLDEIVGALDEESTVVVDGYHGFMAVPTSLAGIAHRAYYLAGGYKYAMAGEGACFLHVPPTAPARPPNTGWWAGFGALAETQDGIPYGPGGQRFAGATADPSGIYRLRAVLDWLHQADITVGDIHGHVRALQEQLLGLLDSGLVNSLIPGIDVGERGHFLTFQRDDAPDLYQRAHDKGVITDYRADRWRVGLGIYHDPDDIDRLAGLINLMV